MSCKLKRIAKNVQIVRNGVVNRGSINQCITKRAHEKRTVKRLKIALLRLALIAISTVLPHVAFAHIGINGSAVVLAYHHVSDSTPHITSVAVEQFHAQLEHLKQYRYNVIALSELADQLDKGAPIPPRTVALTFDDAYQSVFTHAHPLLLEYKFPYTIFVHTSAIKDEPGTYMSWDQLRTLIHAGAEIGNHSHSHAHLPSLPVTDAVKDIQQATQILKEKLSVNTKLFAYPYGEFTPALAEEVVNLGYVGVGQHSGAIADSPSSVTPRGALPRFPVSGRYADLQQFAERIRAKALPIKATPANGLISRRGPVSVKLELQDPELDATHLRCYASGQGLMNMQPQREGQTKTWTISPTAELPVGRTKFNCTLAVPARELEEEKQSAQVHRAYYWWSYLVMRPPQGSKQIIQERHDAKRHSNKPTTAAQEEETNAKATEWYSW